VRADRKEQVNNPTGSDPYNEHKHSVNYTGQRVQDKVIYLYTNSNKML